ncbi:phosphoglycerate mutase family protein [Shinella yambaruensis]|uniref:Phosphoglycerate mutase n=1 Tax=Shinella yambaruensis TaxID=415996 RepID=A0ABQ5ZF22_9HYPH|nr:histidine phosphatase family protein [Shinella yambaruensis]MCJ8025752.1 phosphoglycerate mutase family protein [Shinella yambaruensis]MCU7978526.1 phosphoglycerate mutase family protein [Shinella yambaruensis]GLR50051.1 phosphoglycerate mutase [Shinella yambaruensis]
MFALYITHPQVAIDPAVPVPDWGLSERGRERALLAASAGWARQIGRFVASTERKAIETAEILAAGRLAVETDHAMGENDRSATGYLPPDAFEAAADEFFAHPERSFRGWERAVDAQARIVAAVERALDGHDPEIPIAFVGHGGVGTLLKGYLKGTPIRRDGDQPGGGGNLFAFGLADRIVACDWTPMESWKGF